MSINDVSALTALDYSCMQWVNHWMHHWPMFDQTVQWVMDAYIVKFVPLLLVLCWFWFQPSHEQVARRQIVIEAIVSGFCALMLGRLLALTLPFRDRPFTNVLLQLDVPFPSGMRTWSSFPSDHAVLAFALVVAIWRLSSRAGILASFHALLLICWPRLYMGLHYPSDLLGGGLLGMGLGLAVAWVPLRLRVDDFFLTLERRYGGFFYAGGFLVLFEIGEMFDSGRALARYVFLALRLLLS